MSPTTRAKIRNFKKLHFISFIMSSASLDQFHLFSCVGIAGVGAMGVGTSDVDFPGRGAPGGEIPGVG